MKQFIYLSGIGNIASGIFLLAFWYLFAVLLPYRQLSNTLSLLVLNPNWRIVNTLGVLGALTGLIGLTGIFVSMGEKLQNLGLIGFIIAFLGTVLLLTTLVWDTLIWPILANHDPTLLDFQGPIYTSKIFMAFFILAGILYSIGYLIFGLAITKSGLYPTWAGMLLVIGGPLFGLGPLFGQMQVYPRTIGVTLLSAGLIWLGYLMTSFKISAT